MHTVRAHQLHLFAVPTCHPLTGQAKGSLPLLACQGITLGLEPFGSRPPAEATEDTAFSILVPGRELLLIAPSPEQRTQWCEALQLTAMLVGGYQWIVARHHRLRTNLWLCQPASQKCAAVLLYLWLACVSIGVPSSFL